VEYNEALDADGFSEVKHEHERVYVFPGNEKISINKVIALKASPNGHRLLTQEGLGYYIQNKWLCIQFSGDEGDFYFEV
jgi:hypothetical protein